MVDQVVHAVIGLGPIEPLSRDRTVQGILVNDTRDMYVERRCGPIRRRQRDHRAAGEAVTVPR